MIHNIRLATTCGVLITLLLTSLVAAQNIPRSESRYVMDLSNNLDFNTQEKIEKLLLDLEVGRKVYVRFLIVAKLSDHLKFPQEPKAFSKSVYDAWGLDRRKRSIKDSARLFILLSVLDNKIAITGTNLIPAVLSEEDFSRLESGLSDEPLRELEKDSVAGAVTATSKLLGSVLDPENKYKNSASLSLLVKKRFPEIGLKLACETRPAGVGKIVDRNITQNAHHFLREYSNKNDCLMQLVVIKSMKEFKEFPQDLNEMANLIGNYSVLKDQQNTLLLLFAMDMEEPAIFKSATFASETVESIKNKMEPAKALLKEKKYDDFMLNAVSAMLQGEKSVEEIKNRKGIKNARSQSTIKSSKHDFSKENQDRVNQGLANVQFGVALAGVGIVVMVIGLFFYSRSRKSAPS